MSKQLRLAAGQGYPTFLVLNAGLQEFKATTVIERGSGQKSDWRIPGSAIIVGSLNAGLGNVLS